MGLLKLLFKQLEAFFLLQDIARIVPFAGRKPTTNDSMLMSKLSEFLSCAGMKESGLEGINFVFELSELQSQVDHLIDDAVRDRAICIHRSREEFSCLSGYETAYAKLLESSSFPSS